MNLSIHPQIFSDFHNPRIAVTVAKNVNNQAIIHEFEPQISQLLHALQAKYAHAPLSQLPKIAAWRGAYRTFGVKAKDYPSSVEALYKRVIRSGNIAGINPLVDIYNYISLKHMLPVGSEDLDKMHGVLRLTYANSDEAPVVVLGKDEPQAPIEGEVIYKDDEGTICRRWNWREVARTSLTKNTKNCILVLEALDPVTDSELVAAQQELSVLIQKYCGGVVTHFILDNNNQEVTLL